MNANYWQVLGYALTPDADRFGVDRVCYPYYVVGINHAGARPEVFWWQVPSFTGSGYDASEAKLVSISDLASIHALAWSRLKTLSGNGNPVD